MHEVQQRWGRSAGGRIFPTWKLLKAEKVISRARQEILLVLGILVATIMARSLSLPALSTRGGGGGGLPSQKSCHFCSQPNPSSFHYNYVYNRRHRPPFTIRFPFCHRCCSPGRRARIATSWRWRPTASRTSRNAKAAFPQKTRFEVTS